MNVRKPPWLKQEIRATPGGGEVRAVLAELGLNTVCREAGCPNRNSCFSEGTATFLILGNICTRSCKFCNIAGGVPEEPDPDEPERLAEASRRLGLSHVVVTSVTRDDLPDGGADHFVRTIEALRKSLPEATLEVLIPDFGGDRQSLNLVLKAAPDVLNHNIETVPKLYDRVRPGANYQRSLDILERSRGRVFAVKSGIMLGLGESRSQLENSFRDLAERGVIILTLGQYIAPSAQHYPVAEFLPPSEFEKLAESAREAGIPEVVSGPLVRSSYRAGSTLKKLKRRRKSLE